MEILAVCHVHSTWSYDGSWTLTNLSASFCRRGCRVLMMTEHDRGFTSARLREYREACARASTDDLLVLPGIEYSDAGNHVHVLVWGPVPFLGENLPTGEMLAAVQGAGGLAVLAHPSRHDVWKSFDPRWAQQLLGIEAWNRKYDGWAPSKTAPDLLRDSGVMPFVGLDFHTQRQFFPLSMALAMDAAVNEEAVLRTLRAGRCEARAFGHPLAQSLVRHAVPVLGVAERGRKMAASILRNSRAAMRQRSPLKP